MSLSLGLLGLLAAFRTEIGGTSLVADGRELRVGEPWVVSFAPALLATYGRARVRLEAGEWVVRQDEQGFRLVAHAEHPLVRARFTARAERGGTSLALGVELRYRRAVTVEHEVVELAARVDTARALRRDLRFHPVARGTSRLDPSTPKVIELERGGVRVRLLGEDDFASAYMVSERGGLRIGLEIDHAANHPYRPYRCTRRHRAPGAGIGRALAPGQALPPRARLDPQPRAAGARIVRSATFHVGPGAVPLWRARVPFPYRAALVFVDHADQSSLARLRALTFPAAGGGFGGRALPFTKTLFLRADAGKQLESPEFLALARRLAAAGVEVAPHSITDRTDDRRHVAQGLAIFRALGAATWVDHSPLTNCEAVTNSGAVRGGPFYIIDLLRAAGFRYVWSGLDLPGPGLNLLAPGRPGERRHLFYAHGRVDGDEAPLWLFPSQWAFVSRRDMVRLYGEERLAALVDERGVHLGHTYLDFHNPRTRLRARTLLAREGRALTLARDFDERLQAIGRLRDAGKLWVTTVRDLGDHLRRVQAARIAHAPDGRVLIHNAGPAPIEGLQLLAARDVEVVEWTGTAKPRLRRDDLASLGLDLAPGATATLRLRAPPGVSRSSRRKAFIR